MTPIMLVQNRVILCASVAEAAICSDGDASLCPRYDVCCRAEHDSLEIFAEQVVAMRTWMKAHGDQ